MTQETTQGRAAHLADDVSHLTPASDIDPAAPRAVGFLFVRMRRRGAQWIRTRFVRHAGRFSGLKMVMGVWRLSSMVSGLSRWFGSAVSGAFAKYRGRINERRAKRGRWACPFINKCNGCSHRSCSEPESAEEVRNDYSRSLVAGTNAAGRVSVSSGNDNADICADWHVGSKARNRFAADYSAALAAAWFRVPVRVGGGTAETRCGSLSHSDLASEGSHVTEAGQGAVVGVRKHEDRMDAERCRVHREICRQIRRHRQAAERSPHMWERRIGRITAYGAALVALAEVGAGEIRN